MLNQNHGVTLLIVEHRVKEAIKIASLIMSLKLGNFFSKSEVNESFNIYNLNDVFI